MSSTGSNIRMTSPSTKARQPKQSPISVVKPDDLVIGFIDFLRSHAIIGLAVGFIVATQVQTLIKQLILSFITPTFQFFVKGSLSNDSITLHLRSHSVTYSWGIFVTDLLDFLFVIASLYIIIRIFKLDKLDNNPKKV